MMSIGSTIELEESDVVRGHSKYGVGNKNPRRFDFSLPKFTTSLLVRVHRI
jgi:hypothetical protein